MGKNEQQGRITVKKNPRNIVIITRPLVFKYRHDWNLRKIFWEFVLTWKAFLHGLSDMPILVGPVLVRKTTYGTLLAKSELKSSLDYLIEAAAELSRAGIEHNELRHPQYHVIVQEKGVKILDFERGKLTGRPKNVSRVTVWLLERGVNPDELENKLKELKNVPENDLRGAFRPVRIHQEWKRSRRRGSQDQRSLRAASD